MTELKKDETNRNLGRQKHVCRVCGAKGEFETYLVREMMQGTKEEFSYFVCNRCHCLQITSVPENLGDYYGNDYYSFQMPENSDMEFEMPVTHTKKVLDVGCGGGSWLVQKAMEGWGNLYGCDPFLEKSRHFGQRVTIYNCSIHEISGEEVFDIIHMNDSFEHMTDPLEVLKSVRRLLKPDGILYMDIPTYPNIAFERYGAHWYQLDAPRHIFLHSKESLEWLGKASGMTMFKTRYNSNDSQFVRSFFYQHGVPFFEQEKLLPQYFSMADFEEYRKEAACANKKECGDHMEVYWQKNMISAEGKEKKVIFQKFFKKDSRYSFPYPPVYKEKDTDYICFTDDEAVHSSVWKIQKVEDLEQMDVGSYLEQYDLRWELQQRQIQMGPVWDGHSNENVVIVPEMEELLQIETDFENFVPTAGADGKYLYRKNPVYFKGKYDGRPLLLTIGVPVSNQIGTIERCLLGIKPLLEGLDSELLVIDTGSTDGTVEICKSYGARVISHPWHDNMSAVRNEGIYHAKGLWYMSIDDDEWFEDVGDILRFFKKGIYKKYNTAFYTQRNYMDSEGKVFEDFCTLRMAKITPELHFEGRIHDAMVTLTSVNSMVLDAYAHHYGFAADRTEKQKEKFRRNTKILLQDIYEYPEDIRYLFQLANEYHVIGDQDTAVKLFAKVAAIAEEIGDKRKMENSIALILFALYSKHDPRLFIWASYLEGQCALTTAEKAAIAWSQEELASYMGKSEKEILAYYEAYEKLLGQYRAEPHESRLMTFHGMAIVEHEVYIMEAQVNAFLACIKLEDEKRALELLKGISLEIVESNREALLNAGFTAKDAVYNAICAKLTAMQWEEWSMLILDTFAVSLTNKEISVRQAERFSKILSKISVSAIISWVECSGEERRGEVGEYLAEYAFSCTTRNTDIRDGITQELCLCAWLLKEAYVQARGKEQEDKKDGGKTFCIVMKGAEIKEWKGPDSREILYQYITVLGAFAEKYYNPECLLDAESHVIPPDILAAYRMAVVLADGTASSENVAILKQALEIFPPFHEEVRSILMKLT